MGPLQRRLLGMVFWVTRRPRTTLAVALAILVGCVALAWGRLSISTNQNELFSSDEPHFRDYLEFIEKFPENEAAYVVVQQRQADQPAALERWVSIAEALDAKLGALTDYVRLVESRVNPTALGVYGFSFEEPHNRQHSFNQFVEFSGLLKLLGEKPGLDRLVLGTSPVERLMSAVQATAQTQPRLFVESAILVDAVTQSLLDAINDPAAPIGAVLPNLMAMGAQSPRQLGYFYEPDASDPQRSLLLVRVYPKSDYQSLTGLSEAVESIRGAVDKVALDYPEFNVAMTGRPVLEADEMRTTDTDAHRAEVVAMSVIFVVIALLLRSIWLAIIAELSLGFGIGWTFGWATVSVGQLNLLSIVFVIALIGIGMDYLVQILARYQREMQRHSRLDAVWGRVYRYVGPPIFTACLGASGAFLVAVFTDFRGAAELGIIAGGGLLLCLAAGYTVLPAMLTLWPMKVVPNGDIQQHPPERAGRPSWRSWVVPVGWVVLLVVTIPLMRRSAFDPNLLTLQAPNLSSVQLVRKLQTWSAVVMSKDLSTLRAARSALAGSAVVGSTDSILHAYDAADWLADRRAHMPKINWSAPSPLDATMLPAVANRANRLADSYAKVGQATTAVQLQSLAQVLRDSSPQAAEAIAARLNLWQKAFIEQLVELSRQFDPPPLDLSALPEELRSHYVSDDGTYALYIYPRADMDLWQAGPLHEFMSDIEARMSGVHGSFTVTGIASNIDHTTGAIARSFVLAALLALGLIVLLVWIDLRNVGQTLAAISVLALGLPMLLTIMALTGMNWNFANFFGLPILIGAGHEYGVFMVHRYRESVHSPQRIWRWWDPADRALLLCALITSSSFGFFYLLGHHTGLRSLGWVMAVGTACIYLAAVLVLRPVLRWRLRRMG